MGRPLKPKYFGKYLTDGVGGEGVASVVFANITARGLGYFSANVAVTFSAPTLVGTTALGSVSLYGNGAISSVDITNAGSGYTSAPSVTFTGANSTVAVATTTLTGSVENTIACNVWVEGDTIGRAGDIMRQVGSHRYYVQDKNSQVFRGVCKLVTTAYPMAAGEMTITAQWANAATFNVAKITDRKVYTAGDESYAWSLDAASGTTVQVLSN